MFCFDHPLSLLRSFARLAVRPEQRLLDDGAGLPAPRDRDRQAGCPAAPQARSLCCVLRTLAALLASVAAMHGGEPLRSVEALRALPPAVIAAGREVQLSGAVTYLRETPNDFNFILDDGTGGVMVYPPQRFPVQFGQRVTMQGATRLDWPFLRVHASVVTVGEPGGLPTPLPAALAELLAGRLEGRFVQMEAVVRVVRLEGPELTPRRLALDFGARGRRLTAWISRYEGSESRFAPGARIRVSGVCMRWRNVAVARLGDPGFQRQHAVRSVHHRATGRRPSARAGAAAIDRHRFQPQPHAQRRGRQHPGREPREVCLRPRGDDEQRMARPDDAVLPVPRPQIRPTQAERILQHVRVLQSKRRAGRHRHPLWQKGLQRRL